MNNRIVLPFLTAQAACNYAIAETECTKEEAALIDTTRIEIASAENRKRVEDILKEWDAELSFDPNEAFEDLSTARLGEEIRCGISNEKGTLGASRNFDKIFVAVNENNFHDEIDRYRFGSWITAYSPQELYLKYSEEEETILRNGDLEEFGAHFNFYFKSIHEYYGSMHMTAIVLCHEQAHSTFDLNHSKDLDVGLHESLNDHFIGFDDAYTFGDACSWGLAEKKEDLVNLVLMSGND